MYLNGVLVLSREGVDGALLETLLALGKALVPIEISNAFSSRTLVDQSNRCLKLL